MPYFMNKAGYCIKAIRLRTLPLSVAGVSMGTMLAVADYAVSPLVIFFTVLTTLFLQVLSNLSNELGDFLHGTDRLADRLGPSYSLTSGELTSTDLRIMIALCIFLCCISGLAMIWFSFGTFLALEPILLMMLGVVAISSAMRYTLGRNPYGYKGFGDLSVFLFFGIVAVLGSYFVAAHEIRSWILLLPASSIGLFSVGVLNINNIRDMKSDARTRRTIPLIIGEKWARVYHIAVIVAGWAAMIIYASLRMFDWWHYLFVLTLPLFVINIAGVWKYSGKELDKMLPQLSVAALLFALASGFGFIAYLIFL